MSNALAGEATIPAAVQRRRAAEDECEHPSPASPGNATAVTFFAGPDGHADGQTDGDRNSDGRGSDGSFGTVDEAMAAAAASFEHTVAHYRSRAPPVCA